MKTPLRILHLEDDPNDVVLIRETIIAHGIDAEIIDTATRADFVAALEKGPYDLILADYSLPSFDGLSALMIAKEQCPDVPFILVSGAVGEELAIEILKKGAADYVLKHNLVRLVPSIMRALSEAEERAQRKQTQKALKESEERYRFLFNGITDAVYVHEVSVEKPGNFIAVNKSACSMLGYTKNEFLRMEVKDIDTPEQSEKIPSIHEKLFRDGYALFETYHVAKDGRRIPVEINVRLFELKGKQMVLSVARDITERKQAEKELRNTKEYLEKLTNALPDMIFTVKFPERTHEYLNSSGERILGYNNQECIGKSTSMFYANEDEFIDLGKKLITAIEQGEKIVYTEQLLKRKNGEVFPSELTLTFLKEDGKVIRLIGIIRDITDRKRVEAEREKLLHDLGERVKEFGCIADISRLAEKPWVSIEEFVQGAVNILPTAWQYPEICAARIMLNSKEFKTANFRETEWSQSADIIVDRKKFGAVTICYLEEKPAADEGPFLKEERSLINTVADFLGHVIQHRLSEAEIRASEEKFRVIFDNANDGILLADTENKKFHFANVAICRMLGYSQEEIKNMGAMDIHPEKDIPYVIDQFEKQIRKEIKIAQDLPVKRKDGSVFYADVNSAPVEISGKRFLLGIFRDITERKQMEEKLQYLAYYDSLTDLPNRNLFLERLNQDIAGAKDSSNSIAVLITDINKFKSICDIYGSEVGDRVLKEVAKRLSHAIRKGDTVAHLGNDKFGIICIGITGAGDIIMLEKIIKDISYPMKIDGDEIILTFSTGISIYPHDGKNASELHKSAGLALSIAEKQGSKIFQFYAEDMTVTAAEVLLLEKQLMKAIKNEEFILHYQPYWDITTKKMVGMEALVRWQSPNNGLVPPGKFIPVLEDTGMIIEVGDWILREAMRQVKEWQNNGHPVVPVSVNMSLVQFRQKNLAEMVKKIMADCGFYPSLLTLEITESAFMQDVEFTRSVLTAMKETGCSVSIDDFGTGYSSLAYLKKLPIDNLKIDISFIREVVQDPDSASIVMAIINMAHTLNLKTIAEGIETEEQWNFLRLLKCDMGQGFYLSKPLPAEKFEELFHTPTPEE